MSNTEDSSERSQTSDNEDPECPEESQITEFGYEKGRKFSLERFKEFSEKFEERWDDLTSVKDKEREYWKIVEGGDVSSINFLWIENFMSNSEN